MTQLKVRISRTGQITIDVLNTHGVQCHTLTKVLEQALGETTHDSLTPEYVETRHTAHESLQH